MHIEKKDNRIHFKYSDKAYAIVALDKNNSTVTLDTIRVFEPFRNRGIATNVMKNILIYIATFFKSIKKIVLNPLPLDTNGLNIQQLINFYKKFGFDSLKNYDRATPYLMSKTI